MAYTRVNWQNSPSHATPLSAENLNVMDAGIAGLDAAVTEAEGDISSLETTVEGHTTSLGTLANLTTTEKSNLVGAINEVNEDVSDLKEDLNALDVVKEEGSYTFTDVNYLNKSLSSSNGELSSSDNSKRVSCSDFLFVPDGCSFSISVQSGYAVNTICQYSKDKSFLGIGNTKLTGCYYFRFTGYKGDASVEITTTEAETAFTPSLFYESEADRLSVYVTQNKTDITNISKRVSALDNIETCENISLTLSKWQSSGGSVVYSSSNSRVSTPSGTTFTCYCGDVIGLLGYTGIQFRVGYTTDSGTTWTFGSWQSEDYICPADGEYIVSIMNTTETTQTSTWALGHLFYVEHKGRNNVVIQQHDLQNEDSLNFVWASDTHHQIHLGSLYGTPLSLIKQMSQMSKEIRADFFTITGDVVNGYYQVSEQKDNLVDVVRTSRDNTDVPVFIIEGNHDDNSWYASGTSPSTTSGFKGMGQILTNAQFTTYAMNNTLEELHIDPANPLGGYYYKDFKKSKTRVIILNVIDIPYEMNSEGTGLIFYGQYTFGFQNKQLTWLAHEALIFEEAGWSVVFLLHFDGNMTYTTYEVKNIAGLNEIVNAYINNLAGTHVSQVPNFRGSVVYDFTTNPSNTVTAWFSGHCHADYAELIDGIPHLTITNAFNENGGGYDLVTVDKKNKIITTKRFNGFALPSYDRTVAWD